MLSITNKEFSEYGCINCGCDSTAAGNSSFGGCTTGKCRNCQLNFEIRSNELSKDSLSNTKYSLHRITPSDPKSKYVMESAIPIDHPRKGIPKWHWEPEDNPPKRGEYWQSRGPGNPDISGFVKTKAAGERILNMVHKVLGTKDCKTFLDYRPSEPFWIQFKFHKDEFDIEKLHTLSEECGGIITESILLKVKIL